MTEEEMYRKLIPLESAMQIYIKTKGGSLTANDTDIMKECYPTLKAMAAGNLPRVFTTSCSSCVRSALDIYISVYYRLKEKYYIEPVVEEVPVKELVTKTNPTGNATKGSKKNT